ncbi:MAG: YeeE/YedE family protein [Rubrivivax sp.]|nr:YeeE/YedE family protein [Rubrivivax sp.]
MKAALRAGAVVTSGALFGFGLAWSGMVRPEVVLSFLTLQDAGLLLVMAGGMGVALLAYQLFPRLRREPWLGGSFEPHTAQMQRDTWLGAALFGVGWGLSGVCPGPAIAGLGTGNVQLLWVLAGLAGGAWLHGITQKPAALPQEG